MINPSHKSFSLSLTLLRGVYSPTRYGLGGWDRLSEWPFVTPSSYSPNTQTLGHSLIPRGLNPTSRAIFHSLANCRAVAGGQGLLTSFNLPPYSPQEIYGQIPHLERTTNINPYRVPAEGAILDFGKSPVDRYILDGDSGTPILSLLSPIQNHDLNALGGSRNE